MTWLVGWCQRASDSMRDVACNLTRHMVCVGTKFKDPFFKKEKSALVSHTKLTDHGQYAAEIEDMTDPGSSIKVETYEVFKPIIDKIHILAEYIPPYHFILKE